MPVRSDADSRSSGCLWSIVVATLVLVSVGGIGFVAAEARGGAQFHTRRGAGPDQTDRIRIDQCAPPPKQAEAGVRELLVAGADITDVVVFRSSRSPDLVAVAARVSVPSAGLSRTGVGAGSPAVWAYDSGIAADAHATEFVSSRMSKARRTLTLPPELIAAVSACLSP